MKPHHVKSQNQASLSALGGHRVDILDITDSFSLHDQRKKNIFYIYRVRLLLYT